MSVPDTPKIKIALTDDHPIVRDGLKSILQLQKHLLLQDVYANGTQLLDGLKVRQPDLLLLDLQLPDISGETLVQLITKEYPMVRIIMLTANNSIHSVKMLLSMGVKGYLLKTSEQPLLVQAIEQVYRGELFMSPEVQVRLNNKILQSKINVAETNELTNREKDILRLIAQEKSSKEIGEELHLGYRTVENYRQIIMQKLGVKNMVGMVKKAILLGITD